MASQIAESVLPEEVVQQLDRIGTADVVVGIPGYQTVTTLRHVIETAAQGLDQHLPNKRAVILHVASNANEEVRSAVEQAPEPDNVIILSGASEEASGRGGAVRAIFEAMARLGVRAGALLNSDVGSITPGWIDLLLGPVVRDGFEFVAPNYVQDRHAGLLNDFLVYPLTRALYGVEVRHPIGGEYGFSCDLARWWLERDVWGTDAGRSGVDVWMATTAIAGGRRLAQANLGIKTRDPRDPAPPRRVFHQVVSTLFDLMERYADRWQAVKTSALVIPRLYAELRYEEPPPVPLSIDALFQSFREGMRRYADIIHRVLIGEGALPSAVRARVSHHFPPEMWAPVVYRFALAYHRGRIGRRDLLDALMALFYGRVAAALWEGQNLSTPAYEQYVVRFQAGLFQSHKQLLIAGWEV